MCKSQSFAGSLFQMMEAIAVAFAASLELQCNRVDRYLVDLMETRGLSVADVHYGRVLLACVAESLREGGLLLFFVMSLLASCQVCELRRDPACISTSACGARPCVLGRSQTDSHKRRRVRGGSAARFVCRKVVALRCCHIVSHLLFCRL